MFGSSALEFAIGMAFVYLMLSLAVTALQEGLASVFRRRARTLAAGLKNLLRDPALVKTMYEHPLIQGLHLGNRRPSYIPSRLFALALLDQVTPKGESPHAENVKEAIAAKQDNPLHAALRLLMADAHGDYDKFVENIEVWFNHGMERVSGWYKRYTQGILVVLAIPLTMVLNADSIDMSCAVWKDPTIRAALVAEAGKLDTSPPPPPAEPEELADVAANVDQYVASLRTVRLPIGWESTSSATPTTQPDASADQNRDVARAAINALNGCRVAAGPRPDTFGKWMTAISEHWVGWFITVLAISLGSPFWFDLLNKFMTIRGGGKSPEETPKNPKQEQPALGPGERPREARRLDAIIRAK